MLKTCLFSLAIFIYVAAFGQENSTTKFDFFVCGDGCDFKSVQEAFNAVPDYRKNVTTIFLRNGTYKEKLTLAPSKTNVKLVGESAEKVIITYDDFASKKNRFGEDIGTTGSATFFVFGDGFTAENVTFENSAGPVGQAVAVRVDGDMISFLNCRFLGFQDTLYPHGEKSRQYYKNCYIEGTVDFIFGWSTVLFENCTVHCKRDKGYVTAASTLQETTHGFVFKNCKITGDPAVVNVYLGRPWRPFAKTVFIDCYIDKQINPVGWHNWNKPDAEKTTFYAEYGSTGPGADVSQRVKWSHILTAEQAAQYTKEQILGDWSEVKKR